MPMTMPMVIEPFSDEVTTGIDVDVTVVVGGGVAVGNIKTVVEVEVTLGSGVAVSEGKEVGWGIPILTNSFSPG